MTSLGTLSFSMEAATNRRAGGKLRQKVRQAASRDKAKCRLGDDVALLASGVSGVRRKRQGLSRSPQVSIFGGGALYPAENETSDAVAVDNFATQKRQLSPRLPDLIRWH